MVNNVKLHAKEGAYCIGVNFQGIIYFEFNISRPKSGIVRFKPQRSEKLLLPLRHIDICSKIRVNVPTPCFI